MKAMKRRPLSRRDFLKLAGVGTAALVPTALGIGVYRSALGELPLQRSPYVETLHTANLDGSVPILVVVNQGPGNPFGPYFSEILRAEGLNCFHLTELSSLQPASLEKYETAILAESSLSASQAEMFEAYVTRGGRLIAMKPDDRIGAICGVERDQGSLAGGYIKTEPAHPAGAGINPSTLQLHDSANLYRLAGAKAVAWLYSDRDTPTEYPAIAINTYERGLAVSFAFDLARSIAYMRQGNPERANQDIDGLNGIRTVDMFVDWIDLERIHIPQGDEQQRLFANILAHVCISPLPRLWYFPEDKKSVLIATGDSHMNPAPFIEDVLARVEARGGHMTVYYTPQIVSDVGRAARWSRFWMTDHVPMVSGLLSGEFGSPTPLMVEAWRARGHEFTLHPYVDNSLDEWELYWKEFTGRGYEPLSQTVRTHRVLWAGWMETARRQAGYGIHMNFDFYHVGPSLQKKNGEWPNGHLTGSGRPMKFIDEQGRIIDLYQQLTQLADEHLIPMDVPGWGGWPGLSTQEAVEVSKYLLDNAVKNGDYAAICGQFHVDPFQLGGEPAEKGGIFLEGTLDYAQELGVPIWSAQKWLDFTGLRHDSDFTDIVWDAGSSSLVFRLNQDAALSSTQGAALAQDDFLRQAQDGEVSRSSFDQASPTLTVLLPTHHGEKTLSALSIDNKKAALAAPLRLGNLEYAPVALSANEHTIHAVYE